MSVQVDRTADEQQQIKNGKSVLQRWFYALVGLLTMIPILLLTLKQMQHLKGDNHYQWAIYLLLLVQSGLLIIDEFSFYLSFLSLAFVVASMLSTALYCRSCFPSFPFDDPFSLVFRDHRCSSDHCHDHSSLRLYGSAFLHSLSLRSISFKQ